MKDILSQSNCEHCYCGATEVNTVLHEQCCNCEHRRAIQGKDGRPVHVFNTKPIHPEL